MEFGGEDASVALWLWNHRKDGPARDPPTALHFDLPTGWVEKTPLKGTLRFLEDRQHLLFLQQFGSSKAELAEDISLRAWAGIEKERSIKITNMTNHSESEIVERKVGNTPTAEYEMTGQVSSINSHYRIICMQLNGCYCRLRFWTPEANWADNQAEIEQVARALK